MKKILSLDLGVTSIGYSILNEFENDKYSLVDYGVFMFDAPYDKDGNSKKVIHSKNTSTKKLYDLKKFRKKNLARLFEEFNFGYCNEFLEQEKKNIFINKWELRAKKVFEEKLTFNELFSILYLIAKHRGYKSLDTDDLLEVFCEKLGLNQEIKKEKTNDEKGKIKQSIKNIELLKEKFPEKTVPQIIYEIEIQKKNPTFRNHDNYNYMIRREYINEEIKKLIFSQKEFGLFDENLNIEFFIEKLINIIDDQKESSNDLSLFANCEYFKEEKVAHQYSLLADIYKMYQAVANITFNANSIKITKEQIKFVTDDFFDRLKNGKNISDIKYKEIRKILNLKDDMKIFNKKDYYNLKNEIQENTIIKFHFLNNLKNYDKSFILNVLDKQNKYEILKEIFDVLRDEKQPKPIYEKLNGLFKKYNLINDENIKNNTILALIKNKIGKSLNISHQAMINIIPYFEDGFTIDEIKQKLKLNREEDYLSFKKGIKYLSVAEFEKDTLPINNHPVKYVVSAVLRLIKHLHITYGAFDEIRVESTRELSLNEESRKNIDKANRENEAKIKAILEKQEYQQIAKNYGKNLEKYTKKILMWEEQNFICPYCQTDKKAISCEQIFINEVDIDHIVPQSLGGLSVKHNLVLVHRNCNVSKSNQLPYNYLKNKSLYENIVEDLFSQHKISWKKRKNLLAKNLDEVYKDTFESKSLRATSYIEALTAQILKRYYPFPNQTKNSMDVRHIQGRATSNIRKLLNVKIKVRDTNIHHAIDAILIGLTNKSWLQKLSNTFRENRGVIDDIARQNIKKSIPLIEGIEPKELIDMIEDNYNIYGENSVFYKDIFGKIKAVNFWVSKKPMVSKIHKDTIYSKKPNGFYTVKENIINQFIALKITNTTKTDKFYEDFKKNILEKMYVYMTNPNDIICKIVQNRADEIKELLHSFENIDKKDKEALSEAKQKLESLIHSPLFDNNNKPIRKIKFYQTNLTGFNIRGGLATKEKTFIGFKANLESNKLSYERIDVSNYQKIKSQNDNSFKAFKNDIVFFIFEDNYKGGKIVSFLEDKKMASFSNPRFPANIGNQPHSFLTIFNGKPNSHKQHSIGKAVGIIKLNLDILGNINSFQTIGNVQSELYSFLKELKNGLESNTSNKSM